MVNTKESLKNNIQTTAIRMFEIQGVPIKKQSLRKNSLFQLPNLQLSQRRIQARYTANCVTIVATV